MKEPKERLFKFEVDCLVSGMSVIVRSAEQDARADAYTIAFREFGKIARLGEMKKIRKLPKEAFPVKNARLGDGHWAWTVRRIGA